MEELPRRPDVEPDQILTPPPSLWLYASLTLAGVGMLLIAVQKGAHLSDILVNFGTGLLATVLILTLVDQRLRRSELTAIRDIPRSFKVKLFLLGIGEREVYRYTEAFLASALQRLKNVTRRPELDEYAPLIEAGFVLLGKPGSGKTTWLQTMAVERAKIFIKDPKENRSPILFPMRTWVPDQTLVEALVEHMNRFNRITMKAFQRGMRKGRFILILDGVDEVETVRYSVLQEQLKKLQKDFSSIPITMSSRPDLPTPLSQLRVVNLSPPTGAEVAEFKLRMHL